MLARVWHGWEFNLSQRLNRIITPLLALKPVDLRGHDEVTFRKAVDLMRPQRDPGLAPREQNVGMVALFLGQRADAIYEGERFDEIGKGKCTVKVMLVDHVPLRNALVQRLKFFALERRYSAAAWNAILVG